MKYGAAALHALAPPFFINPFLLSLHKLETMKIFRFLAAAVAIAACAGPRNAADDTKTTFQTSRGWMPEIDNRADAVMVYGVGGNPSDRGRGKS